MLALKIDTFTYSFLMISIEPDRGVCNKAVHCKDQVLLRFIVQIYLV